MSASPGRRRALGALTVVTERGLSFATLLLVARVLEPERFGLYVYLLAGLMPIQAIADQGLEVGGALAPSRRARADASALGASLVGRAIVWLVIGAPIAAVLLPALSGCGVSTAIAASLGILVGPASPYRTLHGARGDVARVWVLAAADAGGTLVASALVLVAGGGVASVFVARAVVGLGVSTWAAGHAGIRPRLGRQWRRVLGRLVEAAWPFALHAALLAFMVRAGQLVAMALLGSGAVGTLGAAAAIAEMPGAFAAGVVTAALPAMAARPRRAAKVAEEVAGVLGVLVAWAVAVIVVGAPALVRLLYGPEYADAGDVLAILAWGGVVSVAGAVVFHRSVMAGRREVLLRVDAAAAAIGLVLQVVLVWVAGIRGAAVATVLTLATAQGLLCLDREARRWVQATWRRLLPPTLIALGAIAAGRIGGVGWTAPAVALVVYPVAAIVAGIAGEPERRAFRRSWTLVAARVAGGAADG